MNPDAEIRLVIFDPILRKLRGATCDEIAHARDIIVLYWCESMQQWVSVPD